MTEAQWDEKLEALVRGAAIADLKEVALSGYIDDLLTGDRLYNRTLEGLAAGDIPLLSENEFRRQFEILYQSPQLAGFFSKAFKKIKRGVSKATNIMPIKHIYRGTKKVVKKVARKIKPHMKKIAAAGVLAAGVYFGAPYAAKFIAGIKAKFATGAAKTKIFKKAMERAQKLNAPVTEQRELATAYAEAYRQEQAEKAIKEKKKAQGDKGWLSKFAAKVKKEFKEYKEPPADIVKDKARMQVTEQLRAQGINVDSPEGQMLIDERIKIEQNKAGIGEKKGGGALLTAAAVGIPVVAMAL